LKKAKEKTKRVRAEGKTEVERVRVEAYNQGMEVLKEVYGICKDSAEREQIKDIVTQKFSRTNSANPSIH
jgi:predicted secreted protein